MQAETVTLIVGLSSSCVAVTAIVANGITSRATLRHQEEMARNTRLWDKRVSLYIDLLDALGGSDFTKTAGQRLSDLYSRTQAFASDEVGSQVLAMQFSASKTEKDEEESYAKLERLAIQAEDLIFIIKEEMRTGRDYARKNSRLPRWLRYRLDQRKMRKRQPPVPQKDLEEFRKKLNEHATHQPIQPDDSGTQPESAW